MTISPGIVTSVGDCLLDLSYLRPIEVTNLPGAPSPHLVVRLDETTTIEVVEGNRAPVV